MTSAIETVGRAVTQATDQMSRLTNDAAVVMAWVHMTAWAGLRPGLEAAVSAVDEIDLDSLLPEQAADVLSQLNNVQQHLQQARGAILNWTEAVAADIRMITAELAAVRSQEAGVEAQLKSLEQQISSLQRQVQQSRQRQGAELLIPGFGLIVSALDTLIDNLVNQTSQKQQQAQRMRGQADADVQRIGQLQTQAESLGQVTRAISNLTSPLDTVAAETANVTSKVEETRQMTRDADGLDVLVKATKEEWQKVLAVARQIAG